MTYLWGCEVEVGASPKVILLLLLPTNVGNNAIKSPYRGIFRVECDFCGVVAITSKTITNIFLLMIN